MRPRIARLPGSAWSREGTHAESGRGTALDRLRLHAEHLGIQEARIDRDAAAWAARSDGRAGASGR